MKFEEMLKELVADEKFEIFLRGLLGEETDTVLKTAKETLEAVGKPISIGTLDDYDSSKEAATMEMLKFAIKTTEEIIILPPELCVLDVVVLETGEIIVTPQDFGSVIIASLLPMTLSTLKEAALEMGLI